MVIPTGQQLTPEQRQQLIFQTLGGIGAGMIQNPSPQFGQMFGHGLLGGMEAQAQFGQGLLDMQEQASQQAVKAAEIEKINRVNRLYGRPEIPNPYLTGQTTQQPVQTRDIRRPGGQQIYRPQQTTAQAPVAPTQIPQQPVDVTLPQNAPKAEVAKQAAEVADQTTADQVVVDNTVVASDGVTDEKTMSNILRGISAPQTNKEATDAVILAEELGIGDNPHISRIKEQLQKGHAFTPRGVIDPNREYEGVVRFKDTSDPSKTIQIPKNDVETLEQINKDPRWQEMTEGEYEDRMSVFADHAETQAEEARAEVPRLEQTIRQTDMLIDTLNRYAKTGAMGGIATEFVDEFYRNLPAPVQRVWDKADPTQREEAYAAHAIEQARATITTMVETGQIDPHIGQQILPLVNESALKTNPHHIRDLLAQVNADAKKDLRRAKKAQDSFAEGDYKKAIKARVEEEEKDESGVTKRERDYLEALGKKYDSELGQWVNEEDSPASKSIVFPPPREPGFHDYGITAGLTGAALVGGSAVIGGGAGLLSAAADRLRGGSTPSPSPSPSVLSRAGQVVGRGINAYGRGLRTVAPLGLLGEGALHATEAYEPDMTRPQLTGDYLTRAMNYPFNTISGLLGR